MSQVLHAACCMLHSSCSGCFNIALQLFASSGRQRALHTKSVTVFSTSLKRCQVPVPEHGSVLAMCMLFAAGQRCQQCLPHFVELLLPLLISHCSACSPQTTFTSVSLLCRFSCDLILDVLLQLPTTHSHQQQETTQLWHPRSPRFRHPTQLSLA